ncbi:UDP-N-acetylmuramate dehydrogenase [Alteromonadaceae bacterium BrNp21-10]|nr:UDP-N-acetylmuramate dehydrogenase [Alteromonadaceae bacterium BrNp21-10]
MVDLQQHHTFALTAQANSLIQITSVEELQARLPFKQPFVILGQGSNTVFVDDFAGDVLHIALKGIQRHSTDSHHLLNVAAGENWHELVCWTLQNGITGFENLALIPGTVGAAPIQNIGAYGKEIASYIDSVEYLDIQSGALFNLAGEECEFGYRDSVFKHRLHAKVVITAVNFKIPIQWQAVADYGELRQLQQPTAQDIFEQVVAIRQQKLPDPAQVGNAGSFFKNPVISQQQYQQLQQQWPSMPHFAVNPQQVKVPAAWLIEQAGFKGKMLGGVQSHPTQPLVLTNIGQATGEQLLAFARSIRQQVHEQFSIMLDNEVRLIGRHGMVSL